MPEQDVSEAFHNCSQHHDGVVWGFLFFCSDWLATILGHNLGLYSLNGAAGIYPPSHQSSCLNSKVLDKFFSIWPMISRVHHRKSKNGNFNMYISFRLSFHDKYWSSGTRWLSTYPLLIAFYCDDESVTDDWDDSSAQITWKLLLICHCFLFQVSLGARQTWR